MIFKSRRALLKSLGLRYSSLYAPEAVLSEENVKKTLAKFASLKPIRMIAHEPTKRAGVLIPICLVDGKVELLYTLRAANLKSHRGQVSFPGGMQDVTDKNLEETALRETEEELGLKDDEIEVWGSGNPIVTKRETSVTPVIARIKGEYHPTRLQVNSSEVEDVFTVSLEDLCRPQNIGYTQFRGGFSSMPVFTGGKLRVWGLTALLTYRFLSSLLPHQAYAHSIKYLIPIKPHTRYSTARR
ncbi:mitochondrial coenzyme A diphosphatase NUDT8 [Anthonomus grandis grandis]|uniref:mitochondrial coenzyme A diphosphatase NUDT8 n=1 Tax=Anthonomus grandis grandis TaxID=2921223 RepID=UPI00216614F8|nr:mitochondrial coenzyme A diphosphatase NUDT8 [Anthonomus grandis grandis]